MRGGTTEITLRLSLDAHLPVVAVDGIQVEQVILNLLRNGVEAIAEAGRGHGELYIATALAATGEVQVMVHDTGGGIPPNIRERLFEPFSCWTPTGVWTSGTQGSCSS